MLSILSIIFRVSANVFEAISCGWYAYLITRNLQYNNYTMKLNCFIGTGMYIIMPGKARDEQTVAVNGSKLLVCAS